MTISLARPRAGRPQGRGDKGPAVGSMGWELMRLAVGERRVFECRLDETLVKRMVSIASIVSRFGLKGKIVTKGAIIIELADRKKIVECVIAERVS